MTELYAEVRGIKLCYEIHGNGEPIILVHGFGAKKETWVAQVPELSKKFKVIIFDNRGAGKSDRPNEPYTMETFADDIAGLMDYLKLNKVKALIGWSLGGMIVQHFAIKYPERAEKIILLFTNYKGVGGELYKKMRIEEEKLKKSDPAKAFWQSARMGYYQKFRKEMEANPKKKFYGLWSAEDLIKESVIDPPTAQDIENQAAALETHNTLEKLNEIKNPVLLIAASHDRLTPKLTMQEMHNKIPNSTFKVIEKAGHGAPLSRAPEVNQFIIEFLEQ
ncbi:MAG: alpha/beta fold hydrolase [Promethearchaeota archaeon]